MPAARDAALPLGQASLMIGVAPEVAYKAQQATVPPGNTVYLFSDGVFEITITAGVQWSLADFVSALTEAPAGASDVERLCRTVARAAGSPSFEDDFSLLAFSFV